MAIHTVKNRAVVLPAVVMMFAFASFAAQAANVYVWGGNSRTAIVNLLEANGHDVAPGSGGPDASDLSDRVVLINLRQTSGDVTDIGNWIDGGGCLITEWTGAQFATSVGLDANVSTQGFVGTGTAITITAEGIALGLADNMNNPYSDGPSTEFFQNFSNIGAGFEVLGTRPSAIPAIVGGPVGTGAILAMGYDWADSFASSNADGEQILLNAVEGFCGAERQLLTEIPVPALSTWSMAILALLLLGLGLYGRRRLGA